MGRNALILLFLGILLEASLLIMWGATNLDRTTTLLEAFFILPFAVYFVSIVWIMKTDGDDLYSSVVVVVAISIVMYATLMFQQAPTLSGDIYRYIWDGKLINNGLSPYKFPPDASQLAYLRDPNWYLVENNDIISPYPPLIELFNAITYRISPSVLAFKTLTTVFSIGTVASLPFLLRRMDFDPRLSLIFAWNPIFILEFGSSAHDDTIALFFVLLSLYLFSTNRMVPSAALMALAVVSKLFPILIVPLFLKKWGIKATAFFAVVVISFYIPFVLLGGSVIAPISVYVFSSTPIFNAGIFAIFQDLFSVFGTSSAVTAARVTEYTVFGILLVWMMRKAVFGEVQNIDLFRYSGILISVYVAFSSTVQPWYLAWIFVPFLVMMPTWSWIIFSGTIFLTYITYAQTPISPGYWAEITWVKIVEFGQLYIMVIYEVVSRSYFVPSAKRLLGKKNPEEPTSASLT